MKKGEIEMVSSKTKEFMDHLKKVYVPIADFHHLNVDMMRQNFEKGIVLEPLPEDTSHKELKINGIQVEKITVENHSEKIILHIHGGGMVMGHHYSGRFMLANLASLTKRNTYSVNYRLSPEFSQPAAIEDCVNVYKGLLDRGYEAQNIALIGESAGGALVMSLCAYLKQEGISMPGAVCAISGSVDALYQSDSMTSNASTEIVVNLNLPEMMSEIYYKDGDPNNPVLSPIKSDLRGWPPVLLHACKEEILLDESTRMYAQLKAAGVDVKLIVKEGLFHTYMMYDLPESYEAYKEIADFFNRY